jgi:hypothetical protein
MSAPSQQAEPLTIQYKVSQSLYTRVYFHLHFVMRWWLFAILLGSLLALTLMQWDKAMQRHSLPPAFFTLVICAIVMPLIVYFKSIRNYRRSDRFKQPIQLTFTEDTLLSRNGEFQSSTPLRGIKRVIELRHSFILVVDAGSAHLIGKEELTTDEIEKLRSVFRRLTAKVSLKG